MGGSYVHFGSDNGFYGTMSMVFMVPCQWFLWYHVNGSHLKESEDCIALIKKNVQNIGKGQNSWHVFSKTS